MWKPAANHLGRLQPAQGLIGRLREPRKQLPFGRKRCQGQLRICLLCAENLRRYRSCSEPFSGGILACHAAACVEENYGPAWPNSKFDGSHGDAPVVDGGAKIALAGPQDGIPLAVEDAYEHGAMRAVLRHGPRADQPEALAHNSDSRAARFVPVSHRKGGKPRGAAHQIELYSA
jgi:hypothetical protein